VAGRTAARAGNPRTGQLKCLVASLLFVASTAHGYLGTFDPDRHEYTGPQLVTFIDSNAAPVRCLGLAAEIGDVAGIVVGLVAPMAACTNATGIECMIIAPISPGAGQLIAALGALAGPDALLGHEFRHCHDHDYHPAALPFVKS
jgi:hypothetical protein